MQKLLIYSDQGHNRWRDIAKEYGYYYPYEQIAAQAKNNKEVLETLSKLLAGQNSSRYQEYCAKTPLQTGMQDFFDYFQNKGYICVILTSGPTQVYDRIKGPQIVLGNDIITQTNKFTESTKCTVDKKSVGRIVKNLQQALGATKTNTIYVGYDQRDVEGFKHAGLRIAYNGPEALRTKVKGVHIPWSSWMMDIIEWSVQPYEKQKEKRKRV